MGGTQGLTVSRVALGCGNFGGIGSVPELFGQGLTQDEAFALMDAAWESGLVHFDTADAYGGGRSEQWIGNWIRSRGVQPRLTTKTFNPMESGADHGLDPDRIARQLQSSVDRLGVGEPRAIQNSYSLLDRQDKAGLLPLCAERDVAYLAFGPLAGGWLTGKYHRGAPYPAGSRMTLRPGPYRELVTDATYEALARLEVIADNRGTSLAGLALAWLLADDRVTQIVIGPGRPEHLAPVAEALAHPLTGQERSMIEQALH